MKATDQNTQNNTPTNQNKKPSAASASEMINSTQFNPQGVSNYISSDLGTKPPVDLGSTPDMTPHVPQGGGAISGFGEQFKADGFTGGGSLVIGGLSYNTGAGNGEFGYGFGRTSEMGISRRVSHHTPKYNDDLDEFMLGGAVLVPLLDADNNPVTQYGNLEEVTIREETWIEAVTYDQPNKNLPYKVKLYRPRMEGAFSKIQYWKLDPEKKANKDLPASFWQILSADNSVTLLGVHADNRMYDPHDPGKVFTWLHQESLDPAGHCSISKYKAEDGVGINTDSLPEKGHVQTAKKYIEKTFSGHQKPIPQPLSFLSPEKRKLYEPDWFFITVYDYGEYNIDPGNPDPYTIPKNSHWTARKDPFSTYIAGFEIRVHRLCRNVLSFHQFKKELGDSPRLNGVISYNYDESPVRTLLKSVQPIGYHYDLKKNTYSTKYSIPSEVEYTDFEPQGRTYRELLIKDSEKPFSSIGVANIGFSPIDLYGEGIQGLLFSDGGNGYYYQADYQSITDSKDKPLKFSLSSAALPLPIEHLEIDSLHNFMDLKGIGRLDYIVNDPNGFGYYEAQEDFSWSNFVPVAAYPNEQFTGKTHLMDITGNGRPDCVVFMEDKIRYYENVGDEGFTEGAEIDYSNLPGSLQSSEDILFSFLNIAGDGKSHLVKVTHEGLSWWPNYGYGQFGEEIQMANFPDISYDEFRTDRVFFADLDQTGTADMIILTADKIQVYLNQSGNSFGDLIELDLPKGEQYDPTDRILFADLFGNGLPCLIYSKTHPESRQWIYDFNGGVKPYLLTKHYNNVGASSETFYKSSTHYYLKDKAEGTPWFSRAPFSVWVVDHVKATDSISGSVLTQAYGYRHSYYDHTEREFRGFGYTEHVDTISYSEDPRYDSPPALLKAWHHVGAPNQDEITQKYQQYEYFQEDKYAVNLPSSEIVNRSNQTIQVDAETQRDAMMLLKGLTLHAEVYGLDGSNDQHRPYTTSATNARMMLVQPIAENKYASFDRLPWESLAYNYERNPADPSMTYGAALFYDYYGHIIQNCSIMYPRRREFAKDLAKKEQLTLHCYSTLSRVNNLTNAGEQIGPEFQNDVLYMLGIPYEEQSFVITNLSKIANEHKENGIYSFKELYKLLCASDPTQNIPFDTSIAYEQTGWGRSNIYYPTPAGANTNLTPNTAHITLIDLDRLTNKALILPFYQDAAVYNKDELHDVYGDFFPDQEQFETLMSQKGRYESEAGLWWARSGYPIYQKAEKFYLPSGAVDPFDYKTEVRYDDYNLMVVKAIDAADNIVQVKKEANKWLIDYQHMHPIAVVDANNNSSEVLLDPLGRVITSSHYGTQKNDTKSDSKLITTGYYSLYGYDGKAHPYNEVQANDLDQVLNNPQTYLQGAAGYFYYDSFHFMGKVGLQEYLALDGALKPEDVTQWMRLLQQNGLSNMEGAIYHYLRQILNNTNNYREFGNSLKSINIDLYNQYTQKFTEAQQGEIYKELKESKHGEPVRVLSMSPKDYPFETYAILTQTDYTNNIPKVNSDTLTTWLENLQNNQLIDDRGTFDMNYYQLVVGATNVSDFADRLATVAASLKIDFENFGDQKEEVYHLQIEAINERLMQALVYNDGFGRNVQSRIKAENGVECFRYDPVTGKLTKNEGFYLFGRWLTSGHVVYNNKGEKVRAYDPYFLDTPEFVDDEVLKTLGTSPIMYYDPVNRLTHSITSKGFLLYHSWTPWEQTVWDSNDTFMISPFYLVNEKNIWDGDITPPSPGDPYYKYLEYFYGSMSDTDREAYKKVCPLSFSPGTTIEDNRGLTIFGIGLNTAEYTVKGIKKYLAYNDAKASDLFNDLKDAGYLQKRESYEIVDLYIDGELTPVQKDIFWGDLTYEFPLKDLMDLSENWSFLSIKFKVQLGQIVSLLINTKVNDLTLDAQNMLSAFTGLFGESPYDDEDCQALWQQLHENGFISSQGKVSIPVPTLNLNSKFTNDNNRIVNYMMLEFALAIPFITHSTFSEIGRIQTIEDPRFYEENKTRDTEEKVYTMQYTYAGSMGDAVYAYNCDSRDAWGLKNILGNPIWSRDARGTVTLPYYDELHRHTGMDVELLIISSDGPVTQWGPTSVSRIQYGDKAFGSGDTKIHIDDEKLPDSYTKTQDYNMRGEPVQAFTQGVWSSVGKYFFNIIGLPSGGVIRFTKAYKDESGDQYSVPPPLVIVPEPSDNPSIPNDPNNELQPADMEYNSQSKYSAAGEPVWYSDFGGFQHEPLFLQSGGLKQMRIDGADIIDQIEYNAKKQQISSSYKNDENEPVLSTFYGYDPMDYSLKQIYTTTKPDEAKRTDEYSIITADTENTRQNLVYSVDPVGNVSAVKGKYQGPYEEDNKGVVHESFVEFPADGEYTYDGLSRLIVATGYEDLSPTDYLKELLSVIGKHNQEPTVKGQIETLAAKVSANPAFLVQPSDELSALEQNWDTDKFGPFAEACGKIHAVQLGLHKIMVNSGHSIENQFLSPEKLYTCLFQLANNYIQSANEVTQFSPDQFVEKFKAFFPFGSAGQKKNATTFFNSALNIVIPGYKQQIE